LLSILHEEPQFLLVNKPAGLLTQAVAGVPSLQSELAQQLKVRDNHPGNPFVGLPHRLDRATSGLLLVARNQRALKRLGDQFHHRLVQKYYLACVEGDFPFEPQPMNDYIRKVDQQPMAELVPSEADGGKQASLIARAVVRQDNQSLVLTQLLTGRMHQIRLQFSSRGFPVIGDELYGSVRMLANPIDPRQRPHALHALRLEFRHPQTARPLAFTATPPDTWLSIPDQLATACSSL
jgi:RluA family pseudouridine synthase